MKRATRRGTLWPRARALAALSALSLASCDRTPSDLREWQRSDHDHTANPGQAQVEVKPNAASPLAIYGIDEVTVVSWDRNCATCHGPAGAGDGPQGAITRARNLTDPAWQRTATDEGIAEVIRNGRGMMPASKLPEPTIQTLVRLVRLLDPSRRPQANSAGGASASAGALPAPPPSTPAAVPASGVPRAEPAPHGVVPSPGGSVRNAPGTSVPTGAAQPAQRPAAGAAPSAAP